MLVGEPCITITTIVVVVVIIMDKDIEFLLFRL